MDTGEAQSMMVGLNYLPKYPSDVQHSPGFKRRFDEPILPIPHLPLSEF